MFKINQYFDSKVTSLAFQTTEGPATIGMMAPGEYRIWHSHLGDHERHFRSAFGQGSEQ